MFNENKLNTFGSVNRLLVGASNSGTKLFRVIDVHCFPRPLLTALPSLSATGREVTLRAKLIVFCHFDISSSNNDQYKTFADEKSQCTVDCSNWYKLFSKTSPHCVAFPVCDWQGGDI